MHELEILQKLEKIFKNEDFDCSIEPNSNAPPFGRMLIFLGNDSLNRERILELTVQRQDLGESLNEEVEESNFVRIQFEMPLPFEIKAHTAGEVASLCAFLNRMLELPGFEFDEINSKVFYRYVLLSAQDALEKKLITGITGVILLLVEMFSESIEQLGDGKNTFNELLEKILQTTESMGI